MISSHDLPFVAAIPRGHQVLVATFTFEGSSPTLVLDRTTGTLYCTDALLGPVRQDPALAVTDPVAVVTRFAWTVVETIEGECVGAIVGTTNMGGNRQTVSTRLLLESKPGKAYR